MTRTEEAMSIDPSFVTTILPVSVGAVTGIYGVVYGLKTYRNGQVLKRQEILFTLIKEFDDSKMDLAKKILDDFSVVPQSGKFRWSEIEGNYSPLKDYIKTTIGAEGIEQQDFRKEGNNLTLTEGAHELSLNLNMERPVQKITIDKNSYDLFAHREEGQIILSPYHKSNLSHILRYHEDSTILDEGEQEIRKSFDNLLDFFGKLGYLLKIGLIKLAEITYFAYYINKIVENENVKKYVKDYKFDLFAVLLKELGILPNSLKELLSMSIISGQSSQSSHDRNRFRRLIHRIQTYKCNGNT